MHTSDLKADHDEIIRARRLALVWPAVAGTVVGLVVLCLTLYASGGHAVELELRAGATRCTAEFAAGSIVEAYDDRWTAQIVAVPDCGGEVIDPPPVCGDLPAGLRREETVEYFLGNDFATQRGETYADIFGAWPLAEEAQSRTYRIEVKRGRVVVMAFTVPAEGGANDRVRFGWEEGLAPSERTVVSVSRCASPLEADAEPGCYRAGSRSGGSISIGVPTSPADCQVQRGQSYFLVVTDYDESTGESACDRSVCEWLVRPIAVGAVE